MDGAVRYYINGVEQPSPAVAGTSPLTITGLSVGAGENAMVVYSARVNQFAPLDTGTQIVNTVTLSGDALTDDVTATETISVSNEPNLAITKALSPETVTDNGQLTYTFTIQNIGNTPTQSADALTVTDTFDPILSNISVTYNGVPLTINTDYTYDETTGAFATVPGQITVPGATYTQDETTGEVSVDPGTGVLRVTGTV